MIPHWTPIDYFRIPNNTLCLPLPPPPPPEFCVSYCFQNDTLRNIQSWQEHLKTVLHVILDAKLSNFCGFCMDVSFSHMWKNTVRNSTGCVILLTSEKHRSLLWLARTHLHMKIYDTAFHLVYLEYTYDKREWWLRRNDTLFSTSQSY